MPKQVVSEQAKLAKSLMDNLGREGAIHACRANGWDGVLDYLMGPDRQRTGDMGNGSNLRLIG